MQKKIKIPEIPESIIEYLDALFPEKCADIKETDREVFFKSGQTSVVNHLISKHKEQQGE